MESDEISTNLEKQLKVLGKRIRIDILKKLSTSEPLLSYSRLQKKLKKLHPLITNISFHLNTLKDNDMIESTNEGYYITQIGMEILNIIVNLENVLNRKNKTIMIRTSKYTTEPFNIKKVKEYLINEGKMDSHRAEIIANIVKERLSQTNIEYMTAPLMREYVNAILLEHDCEDTRHRLTRLGAPPSEVTKYLEKDLRSPDQFLKDMGSEVSEQYLLLNLLPNHLADLYLSHQIVLLHLNNWFLRPLAIYLTPKTIKRCILKEYKEYEEKLTSREKTKALFGLGNLLFQIYPFISEDLILDRFNTEIIPIFYNNGEKRDYTDMLAGQIHGFNRYFKDNRSHLTLCFSNGSKGEYQGFEKNFLHSLVSQERSTENSANPLVLLNYSSPFGSLESVPSNAIFYDDPTIKAMNSTFINISDKKEPGNKLIMDKILLNLNTVSKGAQHDDDRFFELLETVVEKTFDLFDYKSSLLSKYLSNTPQWNKIVFKLFEEKENKNLWRDSIKSISFFGLNEASVTHCGIEFDRLATSEKFVLDVLGLIQELINEKNERDGTNFLFTQPHDDLEGNRFVSNLIRKDSGLSLEKKISLFKKFESILTGGSVFRYTRDLNGLTLKKAYEKLKTAKLSAFTLG